MEINLKFCSHSHSPLKRVRVHKTSEHGLKYGCKAIIVDKHDCLILIQCIKCGQYLDVERDDAVFDT